jgi:hypothetical protein
MRRTALALLTILSFAPAHGDSPPPIGIAVVDFDYVDSSGEATDQTEEHRQRLQDFMRALRQDLADSGHYRLVPAESNPRSSAAELGAAAKQAGAKILLIGGIHKQSTLVQWAETLAVDLDSNQILFNRLYSFRGDSDEAWRRAENFITRQLAAFLPPADAGRPAKLALFPFELEDFSAGAGLNPANPDDAAQLAAATGEARRLIAESGRYVLVDGGGADAELVGTGSLHRCHGCEASIALALGAEQSLLGIVTKISQTDYAVAFMIRDSRSGALLSVQESGLRAGAPYSWPRGAAWLIRNRLLQD